MDIKTDMDTDGYQIDVEAQTAELNDHPRR